MQVDKPQTWRLPNRDLIYGDRTIVIGILNVTPDSFSDGGLYFDFKLAIKRAEKMLEEGADIIDVGGESTRPGADRVTEAEELRRVVPIVRELTAGSDTIVSIDTTKAAVASACVAAGARVINDISGLRFDPLIGKVAADAGAGLVLMHSRGTPQTMHNLEAVDDVQRDIVGGLRQSISSALVAGVKPESLVIDPGIGFGKSFEQNVWVLANLSTIAEQFPGYPLLVGTSRKRFVGRLLGEIPVDDRLIGTMATVAVSILNGAKMVRVHDVKAAVQTCRVVDALNRGASRSKAEANSAEGNSWRDSICS